MDSNIDNIVSLADICEVLQGKNVDKRKPTTKAEACLLWWVPQTLCKADLYLSDGAKRILTPPSFLKRAIGSPDKPGGLSI